MVKRDQRIRVERVGEVSVTHSNSLILSPSIFSKARCNPSITPPRPRVFVSHKTRNVTLITPSLPDYLHCAGQARCHLGVRRLTQTGTATLVITMADTIIRLVNFHTLRVSVVLNGVSLVSPA